MFLFLEFVLIFIEFENDFVKGIFNIVLKEFFVLFGFFIECNENLLGFFF